MRTRLIALVSFVVATALVACDRSEPQAQRLRPAAATQPLVPPAGEPEVAGQPPDTQPFDDQPATKPWVMPSAEDLAVKAAVIDDLLARGKAARGARAADAAVFLGMHKEETSALMAMLPQHIPPLKDPAKMGVHEGSPENIYDPFRVFDSETGLPAMVLTVYAVSVTQGPLPGQGREATARVETILSGQFGLAEWEYRLSDSRGRWVVIGRQPRSAS